MSKRWYEKTVTEIQDKQELARAIDHIWQQLDKTWDGDKRPDDWDKTCEAMQFLMEELGIEYNEYGTLL
tara:strand:- start:10 stop:216 length:207 start_codon:yes stop_codon:yes gene_type:complete